MTQLPMFCPTNTGEQPAEPIQARLLARATDPATSKRAARQVVQRGQADNSLAEFLTVIADAPRTCREAAKRLALIAGYDEHYWNHEFARRTRCWMVSGHIELTGEIRNGGRVWRIKQ